MTTIAASIYPHLPFLRRFARSLTGKQDSGDAYVAAMLEALIADPGGFPKDVEPRVGLYRVFVQLWNSFSANANGHAFQRPTAGLTVDERLEALTPVPRQAFLLVAVEGFTPTEAAQILGKPVAELEADLDTAGREIAQQVATEILIIEDEPLIAMDLESVVTGIGHTVQAIARTRSEAAAAVKRKRPGLVLADVQLADGSSGLDAVKDILGKMEVPVIFITAYPEQVLTGQRPEPTFLIPKPFQHETVKTVISQALFFDIKAHNAKPA